MSGAPRDLTAGSLSVQVVGGPTAVLEIGGLRLLTDPTFSPAGIHETTPGRPLTKTEGPAVSLDDVGPIDMVLLSHDQHDDNLDPAGRAALSRFPLILTTPSAAARLKGAARPLSSWESIGIRRPEGGELVITAVPARHGPEGCEAVLGEVTGFVLEGPDLPTVYVSGDNASLELVQLIANRMKDVDVAVLFAGAARTSLFDGAPLTLTSSDAAIAARLLGAEWTVPLHVRGWSHFSEGPEDIQAAFTAADLAGRLRLVNPGQRVRFAKYMTSAGAVVSNSTLSLFDSAAGRSLGPIQRKATP
jgi:L-ascorbate metabolism protein UlaG (beta-lactamase superfamily)